MTAPLPENWKDWDVPEKRALLARLKERNAKTNHKFAQFQATYRERGPVAFVEDCIAFPPGKGVIDYQAEILNAWYTYHKAGVRGPHGLGKTTIAAWAILFAVLVFDDTKIITTASAYRQLKEYLWPEVHKWVGRLRWDVIGRGSFRYDELMTLAIHRGLARAFAVAASNPAYIEGAHAPVIFYIFDEAKAIPNPIWDAAEGAFATAGTDTDHIAFAMAISTPGEAAGRFYDIHAGKDGFEDWWTRHVTKDEAIAGGQMSAEWAERMRRRLGEHHPIYLNRVEGAFSTAAPDQLIPLYWVDLANQRWEALHDENGDWAVDLGPIRQLGCDPATDHGPDNSVIAERHTLPGGDGQEDIQVIATLRALPGHDTMGVVGHLRTLRGKSGARYGVDVIGIGAGIVDRLRELDGRACVLAFNAGEKTGRRDLSGEISFANKRSAAWWMLREMLDPQNDPTLALPPAPELIDDLTKPKFRYLSTGKVQVESKADIRQRLGSLRGRSTDWADAVIHALWEESSAPNLVIVRGKSRERYD